MSDSKRWVVVAPPGNGECSVLLAKASNDEQKSRIGNQTGGRVFLFLHTDDFWRDFDNLKKNGVTIHREPSEEVYGTVAVFADLYGNLWDLIQIEINMLKSRFTAFYILSSLSLIAMQKTGDRNRADEKSS